MKQVVMMVEKSSDFYDAYSVNCNGIYAAGEDIEAVKRNTIDAINLIKSELPEEQWPDEIKDNYEIVFKCDTQTFLEYYRDVLSLSGLEKITGINQKQLSSYLNGRTKPRAAQRERMNRGVKKFAEELMEIEFE